MIIKYIAVIIAAVLVITAGLIIFYPDVIGVSGMETEPWVYRADMNTPIDQQLDGAWGHSLTFTWDDGSTTIITRNIFSGLTWYSGDKSIVSVQYDLYAKLKDDRYDTAMMDVSDCDIGIIIASGSTVISNTNTPMGGVMQLVYDQYVPVSTASTSAENIIGSEDSVMCIMMPTTSNPLVNDRRLDLPAGYLFELKRNPDGNIWLGVNTDGGRYKLITENPFI